MDFLTLEGSWRSRTCRIGSGPSSALVTAAAAPDKTVPTGFLGAFLFHDNRRPMEMGARDTRMRVFSEGISSPSSRGIKRSTVMAKTISIPIAISIWTKKKRPK